MITCKDCKHTDNCYIYNVNGRKDNFGCIDAKRADGIKECCGTCNNYVSYSYQSPQYCKKKMFRTDRLFVNSEMKCDKWVIKK